MLVQSDPLPLLLPAYTPVGAPFFAFRCQELPSVHIYTIVQIVVTIVIFIVTLTKAAPAFPVLIIILVPVRLLLMNKFWNRETLRFVDAWACRKGTPEDDKDLLAGEVNEKGETSPRLPEETIRDV